MEKAKQYLLVLEDYFMVYILEREEEKELQRRLSIVHCQGHTLESGRSTDGKKCLCSQSYQCYAERALNETSGIRLYTSVTENFS